MLNKIILMGRLGRDPEVRYTQSGTPVASFSLAVDRDFVDQATGRRPTDWIEVAAWNAKAKFVQQYFCKGQLAVVEGRLQIRDWTDRDGNKRRSAEVVADNVYFGDSKRDAEASGTYGGGYSRPAPAPAPAPDYGMPAADDQFSELADDDGELPF